MRSDRFAVSKTPHINLSHNMVFSEMGEPIKKSTKSSIEMNQKLNRKVPKVQYFIIINAINFVAHKPHGVFWPKLYYKVTSGNSMKGY